MKTRKPRYVTYMRELPNGKVNNEVDPAAQEAAVRKRIPACEIIARFVEIETPQGRLNRFELENAIEFAKKHDAEVVIAHLGKLRGTLPVLQKLCASSVRFSCLDHEDVTPSTIARCLARAIAGQQNRSAAQLARIAAQKQQRHHRTRQHELGGLATQGNKAPAHNADAHFAPVSTAASSSCTISSGKDF